MPTPRLIMMSLMPPLLWSLGRRIFGRRGERFEFVPDEAASEVDASSRAEYWTRPLARERAAFESLKAQFRQGEPLVAANKDEEVKYAAFGYVVALAARHRQALCVLDYGSNLGDYYLLARSLVPGVNFDYHCRELPSIAAAGRELNPEVSWHTDDSCLSRTYDLIMFSSSIQYVDARVIHDAMRACRFLFLSDVPAVEHVPSFYSRQSSSDASTIQRHPNRAETMAAAEGAGLRLLREFDMGGHPGVENAPEQPRCVGWFFERVSEP